MIYSKHLEIVLISQFKKIVIHTLIEGIFHASFHCTHTISGEEVAIDARTSDAIAIAIRYGCPIFTYEDILARAGIIINSAREEDEEFFTGWRRR